MAAIQFPTGESVGFIFTTESGRKWKLVSKTNGDQWDSVPQFTGGSGGSVDPAEVAAIVDTKIQELDVQGKINTSIDDLNLGNMATANAIVSSSAPDNALGKNGDFWLQTAT